MLSGYKEHSTISNNSMDEIKEVNSQMIESLTKKVQAISDVNTSDVAVR